MDLISKDDTKTHKKSREESLVWTLQHTLNRVESNYYLPATYIVLYKVYRDFEKRETFAHTHTQKKRNISSSSLLLRSTKLSSLQRDLWGSTLRTRKEEREREAFNTKTLSLSSFSSLSFSLSLSRSFSEDREIRRSLFVFVRDFEESSHT